MRCIIYHYIYSPMPCEGRFVHSQYVHHMQNHHLECVISRNDRTLNNDGWLLCTCLSAAKWMPQFHNDRNAIGLTYGGRNKMADILLTIPWNLLYKTHQIPNVKMILVSSCSCLCPIHWSHVLSREWRCSWSSADRRCSSYIWVIHNSTAY